MIEAHLEPNSIPIVFDLTFTAPHAWAYEYPPTLIGRHIPITHATDDYVTLPKDAVVIEAIKINIEPSSVVVRVQVIE